MNFGGVIKESKGSSGDEGGVVMVNLMVEVKMVVKLVEMMVMKKVIKRWWWCRCNRHRNDYRNNRKRLPE